MTMIPDEDYSADSGDSGRDDDTTSTDDSGRDDTTTDSGDSGRDDTTTDSGDDTSTTDSGDSGRDDDTTSTDDSGRDDTTTDSGDSGRDDTTTDSGDSGRDDTTTDSGGDTSTTDTDSGDSGRDDTTTDSGGDTSTDTNLDGARGDDSATDSGDDTSTTDSGGDASTDTDTGSEDTLDPDRDTGNDQTENTGSESTGSKGSENPDSESTGSEDTLDPDRDTGDDQTESTGSGDTLDPDRDTGDDQTESTGSESSGDGDTLDPDRGPEDEQPDPQPDPDPDPIDNTPPVITRIGDEPTIHPQGDPYTDAGATAKDDVDGNIPKENITVSGINDVDINTPGDYIITYNVSDAAGNPANSVIRTVRVVARTVTPPSDTTPPEIILTGDALITHLLGDVYNDRGATATDNIDGDITGNIVTSSNVDVNREGTYTVTYNVADAAGNTAEPVERRVKVEARTVTPPDDNIRPTLELRGVSPVTHPQYTTYTDAGATATDNIDGNIPEENIQVTGTVNINVVDQYTITYNVSDAAGNTAEPVSRIVNVVAAASPNPTITLVGSPTVDHTQGTTYTDAGATATDYNGTDISNQISTTGTVNKNVVGNYTITYNVTDNIGNAATPVSRTVNVVAAASSPPPSNTPLDPTILSGNKLEVATGSAIKANHVEAIVDALDGTDTTGIVIKGSLVMSNLPTTDPGNVGQVWVNSDGHLVVSTGQ